MDTNSSYFAVSKEFEDLVILKKSKDDF